MGKVLLISFLTTIFVIISFLIIILIIVIKFKNKFSKEKFSEINEVPQKKADTILVRLKNVDYEEKIMINKNIISFYDVKTKFSYILNDDKIKRIILDINNINLSLSQIEELEPIFEKLRNNKEIIAISSTYSNNDYRIAMLANKILLEKPSGSTLDLFGYSIKRPYLKNIFDKIGIKMNVLHIGDFKSAGENFSLSKMSEDAKKDLEKIYDEILYDFIKKVENRRNVNIEEELLNGDLIFSYNDKQNKLIDGKENFSELIDEYDLIEFSNYKMKKNKKKKGDIIGIISLEGTISSTELSLNRVKEKLEDIDSEDLAGIILEINSPGGSAYETALIYDYIRRNVDIPIFISMKDYAASGGYYLSMVGRKIFANKYSIVGSIGVVTMIPEFKDFIEKIGINMDGIEKGNNFDLKQRYEILSENSKEKIIDSMIKIYDEFKLAVIKNRIINKDRLENLAQGKIYLGLEAKEKGLIDEIGTLEDCIEAMAKYLKIEDYRVIKKSTEIEIKETIKKELKININTELYYQPVLYEYRINL